MGIVDRVTTPERRYAATDDFWYTAVGGAKTNAGVAVNTDTAMRCSTVMACIKILSESIGSTPCELRQRIAGGGNRLADDHPAYRLVHDAPRNDMSPMDFFGTVEAHLSACGNSYSPKTTDRLGRITELGLLSPNRMSVTTLRSGQLEYKYEQEDGKERVYSQEEMVHIPALAWDGRRGLSPIGYARETIGLTLAEEEFGARFFGSGTNAGAVLTMPEGVNLDDEQTRKYVADLSRAHSGLGKAHNLIAVPAGSTFTKAGRFSFSDPSP